MAVATRVGTGSGSYTRYGYESSFNTSPGDSALVVYFGHDVVWTPTKNNNEALVFDQNNQEATDFTFGRFDGAFTAEGKFSNPWLLKAFFGSVNTSGSPYVHTYTKALTPPSFTVQTSEDLDTDSEMTYTGCVLDTLELSGSIDRPEITFRADGFYANYIKDSTLNTNGNSNDSEKVFQFSNVTLEWPTSTSHYVIQDWTLTMKHNAKLAFDQGTRLATQRWFEAMTYELKINKLREKDADIEDLFMGSSTTLSNPAGPANTATVKLLISNGLTSTNKRAVTLIFANAQFTSPTRPIKPNDVVKEGTTIKMLSINTATAENNTTPHP